MQSAVERATGLLAVVVGGIDLHNLDSDIPGKCVYKYDTGSGHWLPLTSLAHYTHHHGAANIDGNLYIVGGAVYDTHAPDQLGCATNKAYVYLTKSNIWHELGAMKQNRAYVGLASWNGYLYAIGGEDEERRKLDSIERYDPTTDSWTYVARMPGGGRIGAAVATHQDQIYIIGGYNRFCKRNPVMADVLCLDLRTESWVKKTPLIVPCCHASLQEVKGRLYLIGGRTNLEGRQPPISSLSSVHAYDEASDIWEHIADLKVPRHDAGAAAIGSRLYVVGGMKTPSPFCLSSVECYDVETGEWDDAVDNLPYPATGVACCSLDTTE